MADRMRPDELEKPVPHAAPAKSVVGKVLGGVLAAGNGVVSLLAGLLAGVLVLYSGYVIYDSFQTQYRAYSSAWDLLQYKPEYINNDQAPLGPSQMAEINADYRAWLTVYDTGIDYPVLQGEDDLYYAWHDIYQNSFLTGAIYLAAQNRRDFSDSYNLIYGHHMDNGAMFGRLDSFRDEDYYNAHREGIIVSESGVYDVEIFAVAATDAYENRIYTVGDRAEDVLAFLASDGENGVGIGTTLLHYDPEIAGNAEKVVALSTCASVETNGRIVVFGRMTKRDLTAPTAPATTTAAPTAATTVAPTAAAPTSAPTAATRTRTSSGTTRTNTTTNTSSATAAPTAAPGAGTGAGIGGISVQVGDCFE